MRALRAAKPRETRTPAREILSTWRPRSSCFAARSARTLSTNEKNERLLAVYIIPRTLLCTIVIYNYFQHLKIFNLTFETTTTTDHAFILDCKTVVFFFPNGCSGGSERRKRGLARKAYEIIGQRSSSAVTRHMIDGAIC